MIVIVLIVRRLALHELIYLSKCPFALQIFTMEQLQLTAGALHPAPITVDLDFTRFQQSEPCFTETESFRTGKWNDFAFTPIDLNTI